MELKIENIKKGLEQKAREHRKCHGDLKRYFIDEDVLEFLEKYVRNSTTKTSLWKYYEGIKYGE